MQRQEYQQRELTVQQYQLRQTIQQDFLNILGIAQDVQDASNFFNDKDQKLEIIKVQFNRLILQHNLSNGIHFDISQNPEDKEFLIQEKRKVDALLNNFINNYDQSIQKYLILYQKNCLSSKPIIKMEKSLVINRKPDFNEQVVQKLLSGIQHTDQIQQSIQNGKRVSNVQTKDVQDYLIARSKENYQKLNNLYKKKQNESEIQSSFNSSLETVEYERRNLNTTNTIDDDKNKKSKDKKRSRCQCPIF